jgi:HEAT repeat protein
LTASALAVLSLSLSLLLTSNSWAIASIDNKVVPVIERVEDKQVAEQTQTIQAAHKIGHPALSTQSKASKNEDKEDIARIGQFLHGLEAKSNIEKIAQTVFQQIIENKWAWGILGLLAYIVSLTSLWFLLFCFKPLWLLQINEWLNKHVKQTVNENIKGTIIIGIPLRFVLLISLFSYHPRVLDAWVKKNIGKVIEGFKKIPTVDKRKIHISSVPVNLNDKLVQSITAKDLQPTFERNPARLLIWGEGGAGKTSLACQIGKWAMAEDKAELLCKHRMLPVLIEEELGGEQHFTEAIRQQLKILLDESEPISVELLEQLLKQQRILVIVDHLSEMSEATRQAIPFKAPEFPVKALVVTSRLEEKLDGGNKTTIKPLRVEGNRLSSFMEAYLTQRGKRELFDDPEYFEACRKLSLMVGERDITVLLAKLYADQLVAAKEDLEAEDLPDNIPDLMLCYLNRLNDSVKEENKPDNHTVHADVKAIAWQCLKREYKPQAANYEDVLKAIASPNEDDDDKKDKAKVHLKYLENRLRLIRTKEPGYKVLFDLDPLAEYLAGLYLVDDCREDEEKWCEFLAEADSKSGAPEAIKGFLLAVRDCYLAKVPDAKVTYFLPEEIGKRVGLDPEKVKQVKLKQRIRRLISQLTVPEAEDRFHGAEELGKIGSAAKDAVPSLIKALKDEDNQVRLGAVKTLQRIGWAAKEAIPDLIKIIGNMNEDKLIRRRAIIALLNIGLEAKDTVPTFIEVLENKDEDWEVHSAIVVALGRIGREAKDAVPTLVKFLEPDLAKYPIQYLVAWSLGKIGTKKAVLPLIRVLENTVLENNYLDRTVPVRAILALGKIGSEAAQALPVLKKISKDEELRRPHVFRSTMVGRNFYIVTEEEEANTALAQVCAEDAPYISVGKAAEEALIKILGEENE